MGADRLFGTVGAELLHDDPYDVWDRWWDDRDDDTPPRLTVEEWTVRPATDHLPSGNAVLDAIATHCEDGETDEGWWESMLDAMADPDVRAMADQLIAAIASRISYRMAGELVATHLVEKVDGVLLYDGEPLVVEASS